MGYMWEYLYFTSACFVMSLYVAIRHGFDVIHAHNPPDTLFLVAAFYKPFGKKFVFDHHDLCPELYQSRYRAEKGFLTSMLGLLEKASLKLADITIATNESYRTIQIDRGKVKPENVFVVRNGPNLDRVAPRPPSERLRNMNKCILCYVGALNPQDGVDYLLRSLRELVYKLDRKDFYCVVMGTGDSLEDLRALAKDLALEGYVELTGYVSDEELMRNLSAADICVDPDPSSPLNDVSTWIKIMEYMALGKPIVTYDLKETHWSAQDAALYVKPNNELEFAEAIAILMDRPDLRAKMGDFGRQRVQCDLKWDVVGQNLVRAYTALLGERKV
jgi:glycosyltransferase involved in cell wall biosynthesis